MPDTAHARAEAEAEARLALAVAFDHVQHMDESDSDLRSLGFVICHCTRALMLVLEEREDC